ncbi:hypothetical protein ACSFA3_15400 [Variovorax sp. RHLX14]|uniref:hypothetical protein n=1 Tax=Variovorax sp. RHLX14 TaxID=1259731 RepID=UPI003F44CA37
MEWTLPRNAIYICTPSAGPLGRQLTNILIPKWISMHAKESSIFRISSMRNRMRLAISSAFLACMPLPSFAATPFSTPDNLEVLVSAAGLITSNWSFEMKAMTTSGMQSLGQPPADRTIALANLNSQLDGVAQGFGNVPGGGHYRLILADTSNETKINYNFILSTTEESCANPTLSSDANSIVNENGRWMEIAILKIEEGRNTAVIAPSTTKVCTNSRGKLGFVILGIEGGKFKVEINTFGEGNNPNGSYSKDILIERPSGNS